MPDELKGAVDKLLQGSRQYQDKLKVPEQSMVAVKTATPPERIVLPLSRNKRQEFIDVCLR